MPTKDTAGVPGAPVDRPLRICLVEFSPSGGLYQFALQMAEAYAEQGHHVELVTGSNPELRPRVPGVTLVSSLPTWHPASAIVEPPWLRKPRRLLRAALLVAAWVRLVRHLRRSRPDVVQWAEWRFAFDGWFVRLAARLCHNCVMADVAHTPRPFSEQRRSGSLYKGSPVLHRALGGAYRAMDTVFVLGESARSDLLATFPWVRSAVVIPHGDEGILVGAPLSSAEVTTEQVLFFGTLARYKGLDLLLESFALVRRWRPSARLVIAGAVADIDLAELKNRADAVGEVDLRPGYVPAEQVAALLDSARVVVAPYTVANQSGVVHLAQSAARPVVATDVGDLAAAVQDSVTGLIVPANDPAALCAALLTLLEDPQEAARMGMNGRNRAAAEASWAQVADAVLPIYGRLVAARQGRDNG